nr:MAG TPA: hypothetical protein [Caudoviricetes sp.]
MAKYTPVFSVECWPGWIPFEVVMNKYGVLTQVFSHCIECDSIEQAQQIIADVISTKGQDEHLGTNLFVQIADWTIFDLETKKRIEPEF